MTTDLAALAGIDVPTGLFIDGEVDHQRPDLAGDQPGHRAHPGGHHHVLDDALAAVAAAHRALPGWAATPPRERERACAKRGR